MTVRTSPATAVAAPIVHRAATSACITKDAEQTAPIHVSPAAPPAMDNNGRRPSYVPRSAATGFLRSVTGNEKDNKSKSKPKVIVTKVEPDMMAQAKQVPISPTALKFPQDYAKWKAMQTPHVVKKQSVDKLAKHRMQSLAGICDIDEDYLSPTVEMPKPLVPKAVAMATPVTATDAAPVAFGNFSMVQPRSGEQRPISTASTAVSTTETSFSGSSTLNENESFGVPHDRRVDSAWGTRPVMKTQMSLEDLGFRGALMTS